MAIEELMVLYDGCREGFLDGTLDFDADTIVPKAMKSGYIPSASTHRYGNDLPAGEILATGPALTGKLTANGIAKANDSTFTAPPAGTIVGIALVDTTVDVGNGGRLLCYIGKDNLGAPLSIPTDGVNNVRFRYGAGTLKIFKL